MARAVDHVRWSLIGDFELHERHWDEQYVVFHAGSGDTHLLNDIGIEIVRMLQRQPLTISEATEQLQPLLAYGSMQEISGFVEELFEVFDRLGLIEPVS